MMTWKIEHRDLGGCRQVCSFLLEVSAQEHCRKHFMSGEERWDQCVQDEVADLLRAYCSSEHERDGDTLKRMTELYVETIKNETTQRVHSVFDGLHQESGTSYVTKRLFVVTRSGIFIAFHSRDVSDLVTAYRHRPRMHRGIIQSRHYLVEATRLLAEKRSRSFDLKSRRKKHGATDNRGNRL